MKRTVTKNNKKTIIISMLIVLAILIILGGLVLWLRQSSITGEKNMVNENIIIISTTKGNITVELNEKEAPLTVANFRQYVKEGFYNGTIFHRVIDGFMIQGGGFTANGSQKPTNPPIQLEAKLSNDRGTIAMARTNVPNSATSQFFINVANNTFLNPNADNGGYAVFGKVIDGMDVVDEIAKVQTSSNPMPDWPTEDILITGITFGEEK